MSKNVLVILWKERHVKKTEIKVFGLIKIKRLFEWCLVIIVFVTITRVLVFFTSFESTYNEIQFVSSELTLFHEACEWIYSTLNDSNCHKIAVTKPKKHPISNPFMFIPSHWRACIKSRVTHIIKLTVELEGLGQKLINFVKRREPSAKHHLPWT